MVILGLVQHQGLPLFLTRLTSLVPVQGWSANIKALNWRADMLAGLLGALMVLPQGVAFAKLAGMPPVYGIYSAIVPCIVAALFGSSRFVVTGPTNANSLALFTMLSPLALAGSAEYVNLALTLTLLVGLCQLCVACFRLGSLANFISSSVLLGFTTGAATLIAYHAGIELVGYINQENGVNALAETVVSLCTLVVIVLVSKKRKRWPAMLLGLVAALVTAYVATHLFRATVHTLGSLPSILPRFAVPELRSWSQVPSLLAMAVSLSIVALGQSISVAKILSERSGQAVDANREFFGQGLANVIGSFFSSYLSCGSLNRSLPNYDAGAKSPFAAVFSAIFVLLLAGVVAKKQISALPLAALAALLLYVAWSLIDIKKITQCLRFNRQEATVFLTTFASTLLLPIEYAILVGVAVSLLFYLAQTTQPSVLENLPVGQLRNFINVRHVSSLPRCPQLCIVRIEGDVYFGSLSAIKTQFQQLQAQYPRCTHWLILGAGIHYVDQAGAEFLRQQNQQLMRRGGGLFIHKLHKPLQQLVRLQQLLPASHIFTRKTVAIHQLVAQLDHQYCQHCPYEVFQECRALKQQRTASGVAT